MVKQNKNNNTVDEKIIPHKILNCCLKFVGTKIEAFRS